MLFFANAKPNYEEVVAKALLARVMLPAAILELYEQGEWTLSMKGRPGANMAIDEAHESHENR